MHVLFNLHFMQCHWLFAYRYVGGSGFSDGQQYETGDLLLIIYGY